MTSMPADDTAAWRRHAGFIAWPTLLFSVAVLAAWLAVAALAWQGILGLKVTFLLQTLLAYLAFTPMHEAAHGNIAGRNKKLKGVETLLGWLSGLPLIAPYPAFRKLHLEHHGHTNDEEKDPDFWVASASRWAILLRCVTLLPHYYWRIFIGAVRSPALRDSATLTALFVYVMSAVGLSLAGHGADDPVAGVDAERAGDALQLLAVANVDAHGADGDAHIAIDAVASRLPRRRARPGIERGRSGSGAWPGPPPRAGSAYAPGPSARLR